MDTDDCVARLARVRDADLAGARRRPGAAALLEEVTAAVPDPPARWRGRRPAVIGALAAAVAVTAAVIGLLGGSDAPGRIVRSPDGSTIRYINAALDIERSGRVYRVRIKDAFADPDTYAGEFRRAGLKVDLRVVPASPSEVRSLLSVSLGDPPKGSRDGGGVSVDPDPEHCPSGGTGCPLGLRISTDNPKTPIEVRVGRKARPGERYDEMGRGDATRPGEVLQGVHVEGRSLRDVRLLLRERHLTVAGYMRGEVFSGGAGGSMGPVPASEVRPDERTAQIQAASANTVIVIVGQIPHEHT
jgi:hypothetical protein